MYALLCRDGWGGFNGLTPEQFDAMPWMDIIHGCFAPRDDKGRLIPQKERRDERGEAAWTGFKSAEELEIPEEARAAEQSDGRRPPMCYLLLFWSVWRARGKPTDYILRRWLAKVRGEPFVEGPDGATGSNSPAEPEGGGHLGPGEGV